MEELDPNGGPSSKVSINYLYFGILLLVMLFFSIFKVFLIKGHEDSRMYFLIHSIGQCVLEVSCFIFLGWVVKKYLPRPFFPFFIGATFLFFLTHPIDFVVHRILDLSVWSTLDFVFDENFNNFIEMLHASGLSLTMWGLMALGVFAIPFLGILFYYLTNRLSQKKPLILKKDFFFQTLFCIPVGLIVWDFSASKLIKPDAYHSYLVSLPWKTTLMQPKGTIIKMQNPLSKPPSEESILKEVAGLNLNLKKKPNIYFFIIESLREDFITDKVAPHISRFKKENVSFDLSLSNANYTPNSWFSFFHSTFPYFWSHNQKEGWKSGSIPLKILKDAGYQIHVYTAAQLTYYQMDEYIFGKDKHLADQYNAFIHYHPTPAHVSDLQTMQAFQKNLEENSNMKEGNVIVFFWDSTHFDYSWPKDTHSKFQPYAKEIDFFKIRPTKKDINRIKNRYRNSIHYVDGLFADFESSLKNQGIWDDAVVVVMGDHGEEFFEQGHLFHCSHLAHVQTNVPIYYKFGKNERKVHPSSMTCHMDIFPSVFDHLLGKELPVSFLQGSSIFQEKKWPYILTARYNASRTPYEFFIHNGKMKMIARFSNKKDIFSSKEVDILMVKDRKDRNLKYPGEKQKEWLMHQFGPGLSRIFSPSSKKTANSYQ